MAENNTIARPYARAIFDVAQQANKLKEVSISLGLACKLLESGDVIKFLSNPALNDSHRLKFFQELFLLAEEEEHVFSGNWENGTNFLRLLLDNGRLNILPEVSIGFEELKSEAENIVDVTVTSACELNEGQKKEIQSALKVRLGSNINLSTYVDKNLLGGAVICAGDIVIDGSVQTRLGDLANALIS